jgi:hypothetical protein
MALLWRASALVLVILVAVSCGVDDSIDLGRVFEDFVVIAVEPVASAVAMARVQDSKPPKLYKAGFRYVFQSNRPIGLPEIATDVLPLRLRATGATLISFPRSENDMAATSFGTPAWEIKFSHGSHEGRIFNRFNRQLAEQRRSWPSGSHDDYVLEIAR